VKPLGIDIDMNQGTWRCTECEQSLLEVSTGLSQKKKIMSNLVSTIEEGLKAAVKEVNRRLFFVQSSSSPSSSSSPPSAAATAAAAAIDEYNNGNNNKYNNNNNNNNSNNNNQQNQNQDLDQDIFIMSGAWFTALKKYVGLIDRVQRNSIGGGSGGESGGVAITVAVDATCTSAGTGTGTGTGTCTDAQLMANPNPNPNEKELDSLVNGNLQCEHGNLSTTTSAKRHVTASCWKIIKKHFPDAIEFTLGTDICDTCMKIKSKIKESKKEKRELLDLEIVEPSLRTLSTRRTYYPQTLTSIDRFVNIKITKGNDKDKDSEQEVGHTLATADTLATAGCKYYLIERAWLMQWQEYLLLHMGGEDFDDL
jgi:hypothetical protein